MKRFIELKYDSTSKVPPILQFISNIKDDRNAVFFKVANSLYQIDNLNPIYSLIAFRDLISLSPISPQHSTDPQHLHPINSYKWLYLLYPLASKVITDDEELEEGKLEYFYNEFNQFVFTADITKTENCAAFLSGLFCFVARLIENSKKLPSFIGSEEFYHKIFSFLQLSEFPKISLNIADFSVAEIFEFASPLPLEELPLADLFYDVEVIFKYSIFRLLFRLIKIKPPKESNSFNKFIIPYISHYILGNIAKKTLFLLNDQSEELSLIQCDLYNLDTYAKDIIYCTLKSHNFVKKLERQDFVKFSKAVSFMRSISKQRPKSIHDYLLVNDQIGQCLECLLNSNYGSYFTTSAAKILAAGDYPLSDFVNLIKIILTSSSESARKSVSLLLSQQKDELSTIGQNILQILPFVAHCGSRSSIFFQFLAQILPTLTSPLSIIAELLNLLKKESQDISLISSANLYTQISSYVPFKASYFDPHVCQICCNLKRTYNDNEIEILKLPLLAEKNKIHAKLSQPLIIRSLTFKFSQKINSRSPRVISLYICSNDITDIKKDNIEWEKVSSIYFSYHQKSNKLTLSSPMYATGVAIEFEDFWQHEKLNEYEFKCHCVKSDSFICPTCGASPFINMSIIAQAKIAFQYTNIRNEEDCENSLENTNQIISNVEKNLAELLALRKAIEYALSPSNPMSINERSVKINTLYNDQCLVLYQKITKSLQQVREIRIAAGIFSGTLMTSNPTLEDLNNQYPCYYCHYSFIKNCLNLFTLIQEPKQMKSIYDAFDITSYLFPYITDISPFASDAITTTIAFCKSVPELTLRITDIFISSLPNVSSQIVRLLCELEHIDDIDRPYRLKAIINALVAAVSYINSQSSFTMLVLQPLVTTITESPIIIRKRNIFIEYNVYNAWKMFIHKPPSLKLNPMSVLRSDETLVSLFLKCRSESIRTKIKDLLQSAAELSNDLYNKVFGFAFNLLNDTKDLSPNSKQYFDLLLFLLENDKVRRKYLQADFFDTIIGLLCSETERIVAQEDSFYHDLSVGFSIYTLVRFIDLFLSPIINLRYVIYRKQHLAVNIITNYFKLRSLLMQRSKYLEDSLSLMKGIIMRIMQKEFVLCEKSDKTEQDSNEQNNNAENAGENNETDEVIALNPNGPRIMIEAAVEAITLCPDIVISEISAIIFPSKEVAKIPVIMRKWPRHEDFIPGRLTRDPITSDNIGTCFRDIKMKICIMLGMESLMQEENNIELLVDNNIISLDLPIDSVYKLIWVPSKGECPMEVFCRLTGLDGEATETIINSLPSEEIDDVPPEVKYEYTTVLCDCGGFKQLLNTLDTNLSNHSLEDLVRLLETFALVKRNRIEMNKLHGSLHLLNLMMKLIQKESTSKEIFILAISTVSHLITEDNNCITNPDEWVSFILGALSNRLFRCNEDLLSPFLALLPPIAAQSRELMEKVLVYFINQLKPNTTINAVANTSVNESNARTDSFNIYEDCQSFFMLNGFAEFVLVIPPNQLGNTIRDLILEEPFVVDAISILYKLFPPEEGRQSKKWKNSVDVIFLPSVLKVLIGMAHCHAKTQQLFLEDDCKFIKFLLELEPITSHANIGDYAGKILANCESEPSICKDAINKIKTSRIEEAKAKARAKREEAFNNTKIIPPELQAQLDDLTDQSWECCICHEGYEFMPKELLGIYVYVNIDRTTSNPNTATYFICVHPSCHKKAKSIERHGNNWQSEWDAASLRNSERPCNGIFPLPSNTLPPDAYRQALISFIETFNRGKLYFRSIMVDFKKHLTITANGEKIPHNHGGGSFSSITGFWPFLIYAGQLLLDTEPNESRTRKAFEKDLEVQIEKNDNPIDSMIMAIWILSLEEWNAIKLTLLKALLATKKIGENENICEIAKSSLILYILVNRIQNMYKKPSQKEAVMADNVLKISPHTGDSWIQEFSDKVNNEGASLANEWIDFGDELQDEIFCVLDLKTLLLYAEITTEDPEAYIRDCVKGEV
ncbi:hypothetical protein TRFO_35287 [Tritrichomonas foetus]|uniref:E3 ubiquitin ligase UBR4 C-terminal domain-containing protein n=1 Tax=Tritrichomonas foetus TaxID=1144522 RepID=A0A1J4JGI1_9EUKA|nr:hypothetical protein TRFO_35287 [Tritrichomonas foetus]|eukprot:OHS98294.1 hypothetical protein TRFO_35287 [Tritrichomonas foetus]